MDEHKESVPLSNVGDLSDRPAGSQENPESSFAEVLQPPITEPTTEIAETSSHVNSALNENMVGNREVNHKEEAPTEKRDSNTDIMDVDEPHNDNLSTTDRMSKELQSSSSSSSSVYSLSFGVFFFLVCFLLLNFNAYCLFHASHIVIAHFFSLFFFSSLFDLIFLLPLQCSSLLHLIIVYPIPYHDPFIYLTYSIRPIPYRSFLSYNVHTHYP